MAKRGDDAEILHVDISFYERRDLEIRLKNFYLDFILFLNDIRDNIRNFFSLALIVN